MDTWLFVASLVIQAVIFGAIFRKAGYSGWLGVLMALPVFNLIVLSRGTSPGGSPSSRSPTCCARGCPWERRSSACPS
jgi:hypothetical protein